MYDQTERPSMKKSSVPYKRMLFVCTNVRENETACGNAERGENTGLKLCEKLRDELKKRGLKGKIRVAKSGCMDFCEAGPNIMIFDGKGEYSWHSGVPQENLPEITEKYLTLSEPPDKPS